jgi:GTP-binding protein Era
MNMLAHSGIHDADLILFCTNPEESPNAETISALNQTKTPAFLIINKSDLFSHNIVKNWSKTWRSMFDFKEHFIVSALHSTGTDALMQAILDSLPEGPAYFLRMN